jgi:hypothetical protein
MNILKRGVALCLLGILVFDNFSRYPERKGLATAEIAVGAFVAVTMDPFPGRPKFQSVDFNRYNPENPELRRNMLLYDNQQVPRLAHDVSTARSNKLGAVNVTIASMTEHTRQVSQVQAKVFLFGDPQQSTALQNYISASPDLTNQISVLDCESCGMKANLVIVPMCEIGVQPCLARLQYPGLGLSESQDEWTATRPWFDLSYNRVRIGEPFCPNRPPIIHVVAPSAQTHQATQSLAFELASWEETDANSMARRVKVFGSNQPRNPNHNTYLLYSETWYPLQRCDEPLRFQESLPIIGSYYSLAMPTNGAPQNNLGSVCVISGHHKTVDEQAALAAACIRKWMKPEVPLFLEKPTGNVRS